MSLRFFKVSFETFIANFKILRDIVNNRLDLWEVALNQMGVQNVVLVAVPDEAAVGDEASDEEDHDELEADNQENHDDMVLSNFTISRHPLNLRQQARLEQIRLATASETRWLFINKMLKQFFRLKNIFIRYLNLLMETESLTRRRIPSIIDWITNPLTLQQCMMGYPVSETLAKLSGNCQQTNTDKDDILTLRMGDDLPFLHVYCCSKQKWEFRCPVYGTLFKSYIAENFRKDTSSLVYHLCKFSAR